MNLDEVSNSTSGAGSTQFSTSLQDVSSTSTSTTVAAEKQIVFLVPSVALAIQQCQTIRANCPEALVGLVNSFEILSDQRRRYYRAACHILVATHGAYLDLLNHYQDIFQLSNVLLLVLDECHNCTKNAPYAVLMERYYHTIPKPTQGNSKNNMKKNRPHVLGLTASPLINVKKTDITSTELGIQLNALETAMDSIIISVPNDNTCNETENGANGPNNNRLFTQEAQEHIVSFHESAELATSAAVEQVASNYMSHLHDSRHKEVNQLVQLYQDLGPLPSQLYYEAVKQEAAPNMYEHETKDEFLTFQSLLQELIGLATQEQEQRSNDGKKNTVSSRVQQLQHLLLQETAPHHDTQGPF